MSLEFVSRVWINYVNESKLSDRIIFTFGSAGVHFVVFWGFNLFLFMCYHYNWFPSQRIQADSVSDSKLINSALFGSFINQFLVQPIFAYYAYPVFTYFGMTVRGPLPGWDTIARDFLICVVFNDTLFYWIHRALHHKSIYKYIHKKHHEFKVNIGIAAEYAHPIENLFAALLPTFAGCLLLGTHVLFFWAWLAVRIWESTNSHSNYNFQFSPFNLFSFQNGAERHEFHHSHNTGCYGGGFTIFWDYLMGTDNQFLEYKARQKVLKSAGPVAQRQVKESNEKSS